MSEPRQATQELGSDVSFLGMTRAGMVYDRRGSGPPVVLLHGWCLNRRLWTYQEEALRSEFTVVCPDLPGFGSSSAMPGPYDLGHYASALLDFLDELDLGPAAVGGFAFGAVVAMAAAQRDEKRFRSLALVAPPSAAHSPYTRMPAAMRRDWPQFARRSADAIVTQPHSDATRDWLAGMFGGTSLSVAVDTVELLAAFEPMDLAASVGVKTLFLHGADDEVVPAAISQACSAAMPRAEVEILADCGHLAIIDQKARTTELMQAFFRRTV